MRIGARNGIIHLVAAGMLARLSHIWDAGGVVCARLELVMVCQKLR